MKRVLGWVLLLLGVGVLPSWAQEPTNSPLPASYKLEDVRYEAQRWNNCGPATITNALSYFGYADNQVRAADWLKPNGEDKNVNPAELVNFVNTQVPELAVYALVRYGGTRELIQTLLVNNFPVIIEKGYDPEPDRLGWMGHYLLVIGYDDSKTDYIVHDSYIGPNVRIDYDQMERMWQHFNYTFVVLYPQEREADVLTLLGDDANERNNIIRAYEIAREQARADNNDAFAWFNIGTNLVHLGMYNEAAAAYDQARNLGLPWRMLWYQFGPFEAYYRVGRYQDMLTLAQANLNDGGGQFVEETFYYGGLARQALGEYDRAAQNLQQAVAFNPNFTAAEAALQALNTSTTPADSAGGG
jgi:tetratricopeptide (TPR) repeat protein